MTKKKRLGNVRFEWHGEEILGKTEKAAEAALSAAGLLAEQEAKAALRPGRGVDKGILKRSVHAATPGYNWRRDDVPGKKKERPTSYPELGGRPVRPGRNRRGRLAIQVGTGVFYSRWAEFGGRGKGRQGIGFLRRARRVVKREMKHMLKVAMREQGL